MFLLAQCCLLFNLSYYSGGKKKKTNYIENFFAFISIAKVIWALCIWESLYIRR